MCAGGRVFSLRASACACACVCVLVLGCACASLRLLRLLVLVLAYGGLQDPWSANLCLCVLTFALCDLAVRCALACLCMGYGSCVLCVFFFVSCGEQRTATQRFVNLALVGVSVVHEESIATHVHLKFACVRNVRVCCCGLRS